MWCIGEMNALFISRMEKILWLYALPFDERYPLVCLDERPCFLIGETISGIEMKAGQPARENYDTRKKARVRCWQALNR